MHGRQRGCLLDCLLQRGGFREDFGDELGDVEDCLDEFGTHVLVEFAVFGVREDGRVRHQVVECRDGAVANEFVDGAVRVLSEDDFLLMGEVFAHVAYGRGHLQLEQADDAAALCVELLGFGGEDAQTYAGFFVDKGGVAVDCLGGDDALYLAGDFSVEEEIGGEFGEAADFAYLRTMRIGYLGGAVLSVLCALLGRSRGATRVTRVTRAARTTLRERHHFCHGVIGCAERVGEGTANLLVELLLQGAQVLAFAQDFVVCVAHLESHFQVFGHGVPVEGFGLDNDAAQAA